MRPVAWRKKASPVSSSQHSDGHEWSLERPIGDGWEPAFSLSQIREMVEAAHDTACASMLGDDGLGDHREYMMDALLAQLEENENS